jgi:galactokinase
MIDPRAPALAARFRERFGGAPRVFSAPGRVNLIGEHTDYNEGFVLPMAISERTWVAAAARADRVVRVHSLEQGEEHTFSLDAPWQRRGAWLDYVEGVARALLLSGVAVGGADLLLTSDVPLGAGLSSSAALELAVGLAFTALSGTAVEPAALARAGQVAENDYVGVRSGAMDQLASALGRAGHALFIDCRSLAVTPVALPEAPVELLIVDTGVKHSHAANGYNQRRDECQRALELLALAGRTRKSLRDIAVDELDELGSLLPEPIFQRTRHVVTENERTRAAAGALTRGDLIAFGGLMSASHASLRDDYEVSAPELDHIVLEATRHAGVLGARLTGGGFGGSAIVLVSRVELAQVEEALAAGYRERFGHVPTFRIGRASDGVRAEPLGPA